LVSAAASAVAGFASFFWAGFFFSSAIAVNSLKIRRLQQV
jgi:hypothetical protein